MGRAGQSINTPRSTPIRPTPTLAALRRDEGRLANTSRRVWRRGRGAGISGQSRGPGTAYGRRDSVDVLARERVELSGRTPAGRRTNQPRGTLFVLMASDEGKLHPGGGEVNGGPTT